MSVIGKFNKLPIPSKLMKAPPEKLGSFFLGSEYDIDKNEITGIPLNYDARDLTTHAVCIGMTGSGKTGLCICLLEEAALDKVPAIIIDPKGDITNHLLHFPDLEPNSFLEWINIDDALRKKLTREEYAEQVAEQWKNGLKEWGISKERIKELAEAADYTIYTPGSGMGIPVNILSSLEAPQQTDKDTLNNLITGTTSALLELLRIKKDPIMSKEGILISNLLHHHWSLSQSLNIEKLIQEVQKPPFTRIGVFDLETFYPEEKRMELALTLNSLIASPSFTEWLNGDPLDISRILYRDDGKPRHSIFSLAHLGDDERMFFVTLLLERISTWMQGQSGTTSLRTLIYFDEIFGYMPPVANPPSKTPLLRLLKQGRAFGVGLVLTTQNPVDLDYKGLTNAGTWFIGKLQTERDKSRVLEGLLGASQLGSEKTVDYGDLIGKIGSRVFLMHNVHEDSTKVFHTRWAMNYLRGPLTGVQIKKLMDEKRANISSIPRKSVKQDYTKILPSIDPKVMQYYVQIDSQNRLESQSDDKIMFSAFLLLNYKIRFFDRARGVDTSYENWALAPEIDNLGKIDWSQAKVVDPKLIQSEHRYSKDRVSYSSIPTQFNSSQELDEHRKDFSNYLYRNQRHIISSHPKLKITQSQNETRTDFIMRVKQAAREERDNEVDKLEKKYESKLDKINTKIDQLTRSLDSDEAEYDARKREEVLGAGETIIGVLLGRRRTAGITTASRRRRMTTKSKYKIDDTKRDIEDLKKDVSELEDELRTQVQEITDKWMSVDDDIVEVAITPRRADIEVGDVAIAWIY
ncbi:DUF87 domain-containing protein [Candidatus Bathyarchaeota archaeon]|nr:MAG: DUF87 domain-containing protein [Candidatus Bathyarchaeota archaeon]